MTTHRERQIKFALKRRLCWKCFAPLTQNPAFYRFECAGCGTQYAAGALLDRERAILRGTARV